MFDHEKRPFSPSMHRRRFLSTGAGGALVVALGGVTYAVASEEDDRKARSMKRGDGRARLPPGQTLLTSLRDMGGSPGEASLSAYRLKVYGDAEAPFEIDFGDLLRLPQVDQTCDVHCVTKWTVLDAKFTGVRVAALAERAKVRATARHVIFEGAHGYSANVPLREATAPNVLVAHRLNGQALPRANGAPVRALVPDLYFWKSTKWLTGIRFSDVDRPGYWETRGYHNHADPWKEERYG